jgi:hypothetical protein
MIDLANEELLRIEEVAHICRTHFSTAFRWIMKGIPSPSTGVRVRLEAIRIGGKWVTTHAALQRFAEATTPKFGDACPAPRSPTARQRASEQAAAVLREAGI